MPKSSNNGKLNSFPIPRNPTARKFYYETYGKLLAQEKIWEVKLARYGNLHQLDRNADLLRLPRKEGYTNWNRKKVYEKALNLYDTNEIVRPITNLIASAVFASGISNQSGLDVRGSNKELVTLARNLIDFNDLNFHDMGREAELAGDVFLWFEPHGDETEIRSLDAGSVSSDLADGDIRKLRGFTLARGNTDKEMSLPLSRTQHLKFNSTTTSQYGRSSLRPLMYWLDVQDTLFETNWLRGAQYFGTPQNAITGVPGQFQASVRNQLESQTQRGGRTLVLPPDSDIKTLDYSLGFPIGEIVAWVFRLISIGSEVPITLLGTADAGSRGSAFFANPRFILAIKPKREVWRIGLRRFFIKIFRELGLVTKDPTRKEFDFGFYSIFDKDLEGLADLIEIYRDRNLVSTKTAREVAGFDHSDEEDNMEDEPEDIVVPLTPDAAREKRHLRRKRKNKREPE